MLLSLAATLVIGAQASSLVPPFGSVVKVALVSPGVVIRELH